MVEEVRDHLEGAAAAILTEYRGLKVGDLASLRRQLVVAGAEYKIFKNTLVRRATSGTERSVIEPMLEGPTAIAFVHDDVASVAKVLRDFARAHPELIVKGGLLGTKLLDAKGATALADLPSRDALFAQFAGALAAPIRAMAGLLQALPRNFAYGLAALIDERGGPIGEASAAEAPETEPADREAPDSEPADREAPDPQPADREAPDLETAGEEGPPTETTADEAAAT